MSNTLRKYSYDISIELGTLFVGVKFPCQVGIIWQTPLRTIQANNKPSLANGKAVFGETLTNNFIFDFDTAKNIFMSRPATIKTLLYTEKGVREAGQIDFDLVTGLNTRQNEITGEYPLIKCPDKNAKITFTIKSILREEIKTVNNLPNFGNGIMPDIMGGIKTTGILTQGNQPTTDGFKKKVKIVEQPVTRMIPSYIQMPSTPQFGQPQQIQPTTQPQYSDHYKNERQALINQNTSTSSLLLKAQTDNDTLRRQLKKHLQEKQDLFAQIEAYDVEVNNLKHQNQQFREMQQMFRQTQQQLIKTKTQLARIFNAATELAGPALTDRLQAAVGIEERQY